MLHKPVQRLMSASDQPGNHGQPIYITVVSIRSNPLHDRLRKFWRRISRLAR